MDEKLKNQLMISVIPAGVAFMAYMFTFNRDGFISGYLLAFLIAAVVGGATFGIMYMVQKDQ